MAKFDGKAWDIKGISFGTIDEDGNMSGLVPLDQVKMSLMPKGKELIETVSLNLSASFTVTFKPNPYPVVPVRIRQDDGTFKLEIMPLEWLEWMLMFRVYGVIW